MDFYYRIELTRKVPTRWNEAGMDSAVCRAPTQEEALRQLLPEMRMYVGRVRKLRSMRACYPNPEGILKEDVI